VARGVTLRSETSMVSPESRLRMSVMSSSESIAGDAGVQPLWLAHLNQPLHRWLTMRVRGTIEVNRMVYAVLLRVSLYYMGSAKPSYLCQ
jgi:hypothetical protein